MPNCRDVAHLIASDGLELADRRTRVLTRLHLFYCRHCRQYAAEIAMMGRICREVQSADSVDPGMVQRLEESIMDYASGGQQDGSGDES